MESNKKAIITKMYEPLDIEDDYLNEDSINLETLSEIAYNNVYFVDPEQNGHYKLMVHSNKICLLTLSPNHPIIIKDLNITAVSFQANDNCNRLSNKVSGKKKHGAQFLTPCSIICSIQCEGISQPFTVRSNLVCKLIEINEEIMTQPNLLKLDKSGYIAILQPKLNEFDREIGRWIPEEEYMESIAKSKSNESSVAI